MSDQWTKSCRQGTQEQEDAGWLKVGSTDHVPEIVARGGDALPGPKRTILAVDH